MAGLGVAVGGWCSVEAGLERGEHDFSQRGGEGGLALRVCLAACCVAVGGDGDKVMGGSVSI